ASQTRAHVNNLAFTRSSQDAIDARRQIQDALKSALRDVTAIDKRLDRIKPKIQGIFSDLNKGDVKRRRENFLNYLLQNSEPKGKADIRFPPFVRDPELMGESLHFMYPERLEGPNPGPEKPQIPEIDEARLGEQKQKKMLERQKKKTIKHWMQTIETE